MRNSSQRPNPPRLASRLLHWYCSDPLKEEIAGDLEERFLDHLEVYGRRAAARKYWLNVFKFFRWHTLKRRNNKHHSNNSAMFSNYLKIALRSALRKKGYSFINILGLVLGLSSFILIMLYTQHHLNFDKFHTNAPNIHRANMGEYAITPNALAPVVKNNFPDELDLAVRGLRSFSRTFRLDDQSFLKDAYYVDKGFLDMFSFEVLLGNRSSALIDQNSLALTKREALKLFGRVDVLGEEVKIDGEPHYITAVLENLPTNSSLQFDFLVPLMAQGFARKEVWNNASYFTFFQLSKGVDVAQFQKKFNQKINELNGLDSGDENFLLQPLSSIHLQTDGKRLYEMFSVSDGNYIYIFSAVAVFILLIAGVNYVNLATSRSLERAKEVGIRKVTGAVRSELVGQFLGESALFIFGSLIISVGLSMLLLPSFNQLAQVELSIDQLTALESIMALFAIGLLMTLLAGIYPALALSQFRPTQVLKGNFSRSGKGSRLRKVLVVFQFVISAFLFMATLTIGKQFDYIMEKDIGMSKDQVLTFSLPSEVRSGFTSFKSELLSNPNIMGVSVVNNNPLRVGASHAYRKNSLEEFSTINYLSVDEDFIPLMKMELLSGVGFDELMISFDQDKPSFILNETAVKKLGLTAESAIGETVDVVGKEAPIQAVVKDFHFASMTQEIGPLVMIYHPRRFYRSVVKVRSENISETLDFIEGKLQAVVPEAMFSYQFLDDSFERMYAKTSRLKTIFQLFSNLAVLIACLGMLGLIAFTAQNRAKEVGVRKVLGASVSDILTLLSSDFVKLVGVALLIALPLGYYSMVEWLSSYAYRVDLGIGLFVMVIIAALAITFLTISFQTVKTARINPARILRNE